MATRTIAVLVIFSIILNLVAPFTSTFIKNVSGEKVFERSATNGYMFEAAGANDSDLQNELSDPLQPSGNMEDKGDQIYRVMEMMRLGFIYRFFSLIDKYMFGFINLVDSMFGSYMDDTVHAILFGGDIRFGVFKTILTLLYTLYGINLFTGKDPIQYG